jgi:SAM-dependent methyltransferase
MMRKSWLFDRAWTRDFTKLRQKFVSELLEKLQEEVSLASAIDVGCGIGDFSKFLSEVGFRVVGVDGREENTEEARRRYPSITFLTENAEDLPVAQMGAFDLVLCVGLLYHLENPFRAIRNLYALTGKVLLIETMCIPNRHTTMELLDEGKAEDQGLNYVAFYPSESCVIKMLYRAGFPFVYQFKELPESEFYASTVWQKRLRTVIVASKIALAAPNLVLAKEPLRIVFELGPWSTRLGRLRNFWNAKFAPVSLVATNLAKQGRRIVAYISIAASGRDRSSHGRNL